MPNISFFWPYAALLFIVPLFFCLAALKGGSSQLFLKSYLTDVVQKIAPAGAVKSKRFFIRWWPSLLWVLMTLALMRPQYVGKPLETPRSGRSIMMVLDISESMEAQDFSLEGHTVDRITLAKSVMQDFIDKRSGDGLGLVVFGSEPFLHAPISFDHKTIKRFLADSQVGFAGPKTAIGDALGLSVKKLMEQPQGEHMIVLLTDGQNNAGKLDPEMAAEIAQKQGVKLYIIGLGASSMMVDTFFGPTKVNPSRDLEEAEPKLKDMAKKTQGLYFRARDSAGLSEVYQEIDALEPVVLESLVIIPRKELFYWPLSLVVILLFMRFLWQRRRGAKA